MTNNYQQYAAIKDKIATLEVQLEPLREAIMADMDTGEKETQWGTFVVRWIKRWTYTAAVAKAEAKLKALKTKEQTDGAATAEEKKILAYVA